MHDPDRVQAVGWHRAAIPGAAVFGYLCQPLIALVGERWFNGFQTDVRFLAPVHDGDQLEIKTMETDGEWHIVGNIEGRSVARLNARPDSGDGLDQPPTPSAPIVGNAPTVLLDWYELAVGQPLATWDWSPGVIENAEATAQVDDQGDWYRGGHLHPHALLNVANRALARTFQLPHWLHVGASVRTIRRVGVGDHLHIDGFIEAKWQRRHHQFVDATVFIHRDGLAVGAISHRSIVNFGA